MTTADRIMAACLLVAAIATAALCSIAFAHNDTTISGCDAEIKRTLHHILEILESGR